MYKNKLLLLVFKTSALVQTYSNRIREWALYKMHEVKVQSKYKPHKKYMRRKNEKV